jgi:hypothetical protein
MSLISDQLIQKLLGEEQSACSISSLYFLLETNWNINMKFPPKNVKIYYTFWLNHRFFVFSMLLQAVAKDVTHIFSLGLWIKSWTWISYGRFLWISANARQYLIKTTTTICNLNNRFDITK